YPVELRHATVSAKMRSVKQLTQLIESGMNTTPRTKTISWDDPMTAISEGAALSGLEFIQAIFDGKLPNPPITATMGFTGGSVEEGKGAFVGEAAEHLYNPIGVVHGGFAMTMLDSAMGCAVHTTLGVG